jgi:trimeric autotransporter adhesin
LLARRGGRSADLGFVAEDVEKVFPELVYRDETGRIIGMDYSRLSAVAVQAIKQQHTLIRSQRAEIDEVKARLDRLEKISTPQGR